MRRILRCIELEVREYLFVGKFAKPGLAGCDGIVRRRMVSVTFWWCGSYGYSYFTMVLVYIIKVVKGKC